MTTLALILILFSLTLKAPNERALVIVKKEAIEPYETIISAVVAVESRGNAFAYNLKEGATGAFQIRQIRLTEYNRLSGENLKLTDCYDYEISKRIFLFYSCQFRPDDYRLIARDWNKSRTEIYWNKVKNCLYDSN